jgi:2-C-methyl-D-erythritol 4-phosphate cytidylyltransferase/2-C-methyl-D-erythritol 2,4-cyclodiphosphate synthase
MSVTALIVAAGTGERVGGGVPKQFRTIAGKPVLRWAVEALASHRAVREVRVVIGRGQEDQAQQALAGVPVGSLIEGGSQRSDSVRAGLAALEGDAVLVHDAARPFCPSAVIDRLLPPLEFFEGAAPVLAVGDTLARASDRLGEPIDRRAMVRVQTPQAFRLNALRAAYEHWDGTAPTDETTVVGAAGMQVAAVVRIEEHGTRQIPVPMPSAVAYRAGMAQADAAPPIAPGETTLRAMVTLTVALR